MRITRLEYLLYLKVILSSIQSISKNYVTQITLRREYLFIAVRSRSQYFFAGTSDTVQQILAKWKEADPWSRVIEGLERCERVVQEKNTATVHETQIAAGFTYRSLVVVGYNTRKGGRERGMNLYWKKRESEW